MYCSSLPATAARPAARPVVTCCTPPCSPGRMRASTTTVVFCIRRLTQCSAVGQDLAGKTVDEAAQKEQGDGAGRTSEYRVECARHEQGDEHDEQHTEQPHL